jgi:predicted RNase H-like HicB family nuclease
MQSVCHNFCLILFIDRPNIIQYMQHHSASTVSKKTYHVILDRDDEDGMIFARCDELHANAEGKTESEVKDSIKEAIEMMVEDLNKDKDYSLKFIRKYSA